MKIKNILSIAAAMALAACSNSDGLDTAQVALSINATVAGSDTRAAISSFSKDSEIAVLVGDATSYVGFTTEDGTSFAPAGDPIYFNAEKMDVKAYYPFVESGEINTAEQETVSDYLYADGTASILSGKVDLVFEHQMSMITLTFALGDGFSGDIDPGKLTDVAITGLKTKGEFTAPSSIVADADDAANASIALVMDGATGQCIVIPQEASQIQLSATYDGNDYAATISVKGGELTAGNNYRYAVKIDKARLTVSSESGVVAWSTTTGVIDDADYEDTASNSTTPVD
jgi:hypothetical protein